MKGTAILLPCYNEALTITKTITDFRNALPNATIYVFDNSSTDDSAAL
ncbi:MAG: glycosyltransferase, partial [Lentisphaeria bacterium]|nr:glycosyltransferase [Lentisphaeria bacterium]